MGHKMAILVKSYGLQQNQRSGVRGRGEREREGEGERSANHLTEPWVLFLLFSLHIGSYRIFLKVHKT